MNQPMNRWARRDALWCWFEHPPWWQRTEREVLWGGAEALAAHMKAFGSRPKGCFIVSHRKPKSSWLVGNKERNLLAQITPESKGVWYQAWLDPGGH